jgi:hypothetical protein
MPRSKPVKRVRIIKSTDLVRLSENATSAITIKPFETVTVSTPESHSVYEHNELSDVEPKQTEAILFKMPWDDPQQENFLKSIIPITTSDFNRLFVERTKSECESEETKEPRSSEWHKARAFSVTASQFGSTIGHNKYMSKNALLKSKLHPHIHEKSPYIEWGLNHEQHAEEAFVHFLTEKQCNFKIDHPGLLKDPMCSWTACSPDGILRRFEDGREIIELIEYKAPAYHRSALGHPYQKHLHNIPPMYLDQMQGSMWLIKNKGVIQNGACLQGGWFVVWKPHALHVTYVPYVHEYASMLMTGVKAFFDEDFVPACLDKINNFV